MEIPNLGAVTKSKQYDWHYSEPISVPVLDGKKCRIVVEGYDEDSNKEEFHATIANFLSSDPSVLKKAESHVFKYYKDCNENWDPDDEEFVTIKSPADVWNYMHLGDEPMVKRRAYGDQKIYVSLECNCDWEPEHGLQIVFKDGLTVSKVGPYDGHLANSDAYDDESLEGVFYRGQP